LARSRQRIPRQVDVIADILSSCSRNYRENGKIVDMFKFAERHCIYKKYENIYNSFQFKTSEILKKILSYKTELKLNNM